jgi:subtilisin-like proprotein convertase family protein
MNVIVTCERVELSADQMGRVVVTLIEPTPGDIASHLKELRKELNADDITDALSVADIIEGLRSREPDRWSLYKTLDNEYGEIPELTEFLDQLSIAQKVEAYEILKSEYPFH